MTTATHFFRKHKKHLLQRPGGRAGNDWIDYLWTRFQLAANPGIIMGTRLYTLRDDGTVDPGFGIVDVDGYFVSAEPMKGLVRGLIAPKPF